MRFRAPKAASSMLSRRTLAQSFENNEALPRRIHIDLTARRPHHGSIREWSRSCVTIPL